MVVSRCVTVPRLWEDYSREGRWRGFGSTIPLFDHQEYRPQTSPLLYYHIFLKLPIHLLPRTRSPCALQDLPSVSLLNAAALQARWGHFPRLIRQYPHLGGGVTHIPIAILVIRGTLLQGLPEVTSSKLTYFFHLLSLCLKDNTIGQKQCNIYLVKRTVRFWVMLQL